MTFRYYDDEYREHLRVAISKANDDFFAKARKEAEARKAMVAANRGTRLGYHSGWVETYNLIVEHRPGSGSTNGTRSCLVRMGDDSGIVLEVLPEYGTNPKRFFLRAKTEYGYNSLDTVFDDYESAVQHAMVMALSVAYVEPLALAKKAAEAEAEAKKKRVVKPKK